MKIAVIGIGGVGGYFGGKLAHRYSSSGKHEVIFIARGNHLQKIKDSGLTVTTKDEGTFIARPDMATDFPKDIGPVDVIFFSVKGYDLENAAASMMPVIHDRTVSISLLNGVDNVERLATVIDRGTILNGCVYISSYVVEPGMIRQVGGPCSLFFGPESGPVDSYRDLEIVLKNAHINAVLSERIAVDAWSKYIFVGPLGGLSSMVEKPLGTILETKEHRIMLEGLMREVESTARAHGIPLPDTIVQQSLDMASKFPYETKTSIQLDFEKGTRTELETFVGYLVRAGRQAGIATPLHESVYETLKKKEGS
jgi:2-dehydropantoate 2-reductase